MYMYCSMEEIHNISQYGVIKKIVSWEPEGR